MKIMPFTREEIEGSIPERFERVVTWQPLSTAVKSEDCTFTYDSLNRLANRLAHAILREVVQPDEFTGEGEPVILFFDHEAPVVAAILGVLKAGKIYVAIDPGTPPARSLAILEDLQARLVITDCKHFHRASTLAGNTCRVLNLDQLGADLPDWNPGLPVQPTTLAAVHYTSGTTGRPKGVERSHQFILHRVWFETNDYAIRPQDHFSLIHSVSFGASEPDIFDALLNGATLSLFDIKKKGLPPLITWLNKEGISFFHIPSDLFRVFVASLSPTDFFPHLRQVTPSGRLYKKDVERIRPHLSEDCILIQRLSSSETGMITRLKIGKDTAISSNVLPVGYAITDKDVFILDDHGMVLDFDQVGEIVVKSRYLATGYWKQPDLTIKAFQPDPDNEGRKIYHLGDFGRMRPDGCLELVGRKDSRVKIRGYRVEPGEIEAVLLNIESVREAVVVARDGLSGEKRLAAYVVPVEEGAISIGSLRNALLEQLPDYMIPAHFMLVEQLPLTDRAKIDYNALPDPDQSRPELESSYVAPQTPTQAVLAEIWSQVFEFAPVGIHDNFFELGGQSLLAVKALSLIAATLQVDIELSSLFENPTISALAEVVDAGRLCQSRYSDQDLQRAIKWLGID